MDKFDVLGSWKDIHSKKIERFAFQYGLTLEMAYEVTLDTFVSFHNQFGNADDGESILPAVYKLAIQKLAQTERLLSTVEGVFPFEEDAELHSQIVKLDEKYRLPFILSQFHSFTNDQIALILDCSTVEVGTNIQTAKNLLGMDQLEKRIELLGKSYNRLSVRFKAEQIMGKTAPPEIKKEKFNITKWSVATIVLLIGILIVTFFLTNVGEIINLSTSDFEVRYKEERGRHQKTLQLENDRFGKLNFVQEADRKLASLIAKEKTSSQEELETEFKEIIKVIKLPSEMLADFLLISPMRDDEDGSIAFLSSYRTKVMDLISLYDEILWDYRKDVEGFEVESYVNKADRMMISSDEFPKELKNVLNSMENQSIHLILNKSTGKIEANHFGSNIYNDVRWKFHSNIYGYVSMLAAEPYIVGGVMTHPIEELFYHVFAMQDTLEKVKMDKVLYPAMYAEYVSLFYNIVKGSASTNIFDEQEILKNEYKGIWQKFSNTFEAHPANYLMMPIVEEMEASGWKSSKSWDEFSTEKIEEALELARIGQLENVMYGERPAIEDDSIVLPDPEFFSRVGELYNEFKKSYDISVFKGLSPIYVVGVFDYANEMEDPTTMYHLFRENIVLYLKSGEVVSLEEYVAQWRKGFSFLKDANGIDFFGSSMDRLRHDFSAYVEINFSNGQRSVGVYLDVDQNWFMQETWHEELPSAQIEPGIEVNSDFKREVKSLYRAFSQAKNSFVLGEVTASNLVGLYFYAAELGDFETQYALYFLDENYPVIEKEQYLVEASLVPQWKMEDMFKTISFKGKEQDENGNWPGVVTLTVNQEKNPGGAQIKSFQMMWTKQGWRIMFNPMQ